MMTWIFSPRWDLAVPVAPAVAGVRRAMAEPAREL